MKMLLADQLRNDPRIQEAKKLILDTLKEYQSQLQEPKKADPHFSLSYAEFLEQITRLRGNPLWYPYIASGLGRGSLVELADGSVKYDFISGVGVHFSHGHPQLTEAAIDAALSSSIMQGNLQQTREPLTFMANLTKASGLDHCFLTSSGAMACENGLKIAFQKAYPKSRILAFNHCFMGRTCTLSRITDKPFYRQGLPPNISVDYVPFFNPEAPQASTQLALKTLIEHLARYPNEHAAMCFELVQGEGGVYPGSREFFLPLMDLLKESGIAIIVDEVQTFGRTSRLFAYQHFDLGEYVDIATCGKLSQVCATLWKKNFNPKPGLLSQTFTASSSAIYAADSILHALLSDGYFGEEGKNNRLHAHFTSRLNHLSSRYPDLIRGPFGIGMMIGFTPFDGSVEKANTLCRSLFDNGVICYTAGVHPTRIRFLPPIGALDRAQIDHVCDILELTIKENVALC